MIPDLNDKLDKLISNVSDDSIAKMNWRYDNRGWLNMLQKLAMVILDQMDNLKLNPIDLSIGIDLPLNQINNILKGKENLTLELIFKLSKFLKIDLIEIKSCGI